MVLLHLNIGHGCNDLNLPRMSPIQSTLCTIHGLISTIDWPINLNVVIVLEAASFHVITDTECCRFCPPGASEGVKYLGGQG